MEKKKRRCVMKPRLRERLQNNIPIRNFNSTFRILSRLNRAQNARIVKISKSKLSILRKISTQLKPYRELSKIDREFSLRLYTFSYKSIANNPQSYLSIINEFMDTNQSQE